MAWYQVIPDKQEISRIQQLEADGMVADMPECDGLYIVGYLRDIGFDNASSVEIESWSRQSGIELEAWEFDFIRKLSREYMSQYNDKKSNAPYEPEELSDQNAKAVADKVRGALKWLSSGS